MIDLLIVWLWAPVTLLSVCVGLSLLAERVSGFEVPWSVRPALGLAVAITVAQIGVSFELTAKLIAPLIVAVGIASLARAAFDGVLCRSRPPLPALVAALGVFLVFAAPVLVYGEPTWTGFIKLDDSATWMALANHAFTNGPTIALEPSTYEALIQINAGNGYPIGSLVPMQLLSTLSGQDLAWTLQPSMAFMAFTLALLLAEAVRGVSARPWVSAAIAFLGAQAALLLGFVLWGGVKEIAIVALLPLGPLLAARGIGLGGGRVWVLIGIQAAAVISCLGPGGVGWLVPTLGAMLIPVVAALGWRVALSWVVKATLVVAALVLPQMIVSNGFFTPFQSPLTNDTELGNLTGPLNVFQAAGVWPATDFRGDPELAALTKAAALAIALLAIWAAAVSWRRLPALFAYVAGTLVAAGVIYAVGSPWVDGKALATLSPALLTGALAGAALLAQRTRTRALGLGLATVFAALVVWSSLLAYQGAWMAPAERMAELERIGDEFSGEGTALYTERSAYGARHFLRELDAEGEFDLRRRSVLLASGEAPDETGSGDIDEIRFDQLDPYEILVMPRSPYASRPPSTFDRVRIGSHYEVWKRNVSPGPAEGDLLQRIPLGEYPNPAALPDCVALGILAGRGDPAAVLVAAEPPRPQTVDLAANNAPSSWQIYEASQFRPDDPGTMALAFELAEAGTYEIWLGGSVFAPLDVEVDGRPLARMQNQLIGGATPQLVGTVQLEAGRHVLSFRHHGRGAQVGSGVDPGWLGPLVLDRVERIERGLVSVPVADYRELCDRPWDWIELYSGLVPGAS